MNKKCSTEGGDQEGMAKEELEEMWLNELI